MCTRNNSRRNNSSRNNSSRNNSRRNKGFNIGYRSNKVSGIGVINYSLLKDLYAPKRHVPILASHSIGYIPYFLCVRTYLISQQYVCTCPISQWQYHSSTYVLVLYLSGSSGIVQGMCPDCYAYVLVLMLSSMYVLDLYLVSSSTQK